MSTCVVDSCAVAALLFCEPQADEIAERLDGMMLVAPPLFWYEMTSVALRKIKQQPHLRESILTAMDLLNQMDIQRMEVDPGEIVAFAEHYDMPINNAHYVWLASKLGAQIVTLKSSMARSLATVTAGKSRSLHVISATNTAGQTETVM